MNNEQFRQASLPISVENTSIKLNELKDRDPLFVEWAKPHIKSKRIDSLVKHMDSYDIAENRTHAIDILEESVLLNDTDNVSLRTADFKNRAHTYGTKKLLASLDHGTSATERDLTRLEGLNYGSISHRAIVDLYRGDVGLHTWETAKRHKDIPLFNQQKVSIIRPLQIGEIDNGRLSESYVGEIDYVWNLLRSMIEDDPRLPYFEDEGEYIRSLEELLAPVFGVHYSDAIRLKNRSSHEHDHRFLYTLMSWATAVIDRHNRGNTPIFSEIPVFNFSRNGFDGGRIDGLEISRADGEQLSEEDEAIVRYYSYDKYSSVGDVVQEMQREMRAGDISARIYDFKFAIGDAVGGKKMIEIEEIAEGPLTNHANQVARYLTMAPIDYLTATQEDIDIKNIWDYEDPFTEGVIIYLHPLQMPVSHTISLQPEEKQEIWNEFRNKSGNSQRRATLRHIDNRLNGSLTELFSKGRTKFKNGNSPKLSSTMKSLLTEDL